MTSSAYAIAWIGQLGGIQHIQIASESHKNITRAAEWPVPVLIHETSGKTFSQAADACKALLKMRLPEWERFLRDPTRMRPIAPQLRAAATARAQAAGKLPRR